MSKYNRNSMKRLLLGMSLACAQSLFGAATSVQDDAAVSEAPITIPTLQELALRHPASRISQELLEPEISGVLSYLTSFIKTSEPITQEEVIHAINAQAQIPDEYKPMLFDLVAERVAKEYFLRLPTGGLQRSPDRLPQWLQAYFKGISIQDLLDKDLLKRVVFYDAVDPISSGVGMVCSLVSSYVYPAVYADRMHINDVTGLENVPDKQTIQYIYLSFNNIEQILPGLFLQFPSLRELDFTGNPINRNVKERARIESEVRAATNGKGRVKWYL